MAAAKRSGHARLKAALVLRDALAAELGVQLSAAMTQLRTVEDNIGVGPALADGKYLEALGSVCQGDAAHLSTLDAEVRQACDRARFSPRYAQYMALVLFVHWLHAQQDDAAAFLARLNDFLSTHKPKNESVSEFTETDLQLAAFWMATAAGKTHVLHACLALLEKQRSWDRLILITPSEPLTRQHAAKLRALSTWEVFAYPMDGDASSMGRLPRDAVIVLDINKLATEKKGDGVTVPTSVFSEGRNLVFVDEGHKGQKSETSVWKALQADLAGISDPQSQHRGLLVEFSATFGQVAEAEHAFDRYAKAVIFDYAYDRFHRDRYGKDFWHMRVQAKGDASEAAQYRTLTAALLAYWHQVACFRSSAGKRICIDRGLQVAPPLWVLLGLSVIGGSGKGDKEQTSDVIEVLKYLSTILAQPARLSQWLESLLAAATTGGGMLPAEVRQAITEKVTVGSNIGALTECILSDCFGWQHGDKPVLRLIKSATGELGLGLLRGDVSHYYGVINVGDAAGLRKALESAELPVEDDSISGSLFAALDGTSKTSNSLNVLIGSRRFAEGWDNYRVSSLTLLRLGQGEGSLIIQMFGRVVRFMGTNGDGKRLDTPSPALLPLQTAYVFGLKSDYLDTFLQSLLDNGVPESKRVECDVRKHAPPLLRSVCAVAPEARAFQVAALGSKWVSGVNKVKISLTTSIATTKLKEGAIAAQQGVIGEDITAEFKRWGRLLDRDALYREMMEWKRTRRLWNFTFDRQAIDSALASDKFAVLGLPGMLDVQEGADLARLNRLASTVVRRLFESAYRKEESKRSRYMLIGANESGIPDKYYKDFVNGQ
ncbi:MAG: DEAD/DEAH box helicase family protein [Nitrosospira multiformis]|nr:DEAD/DEAH box helicase family protein [Nitrosospira multiformis]